MSAALDAGKQHREDNPRLYCPVRRCRWPVSAGPCPKLGHQRRADEFALNEIENMIEEAHNNEITIARRRDGNVWISDGANTRSGLTLRSALAPITSLEQAAGSLRRKGKG